MIKEDIEKIVSKQDLTYDEAYTVMNEIMLPQNAAPPTASKRSASTSTSRPLKSSRSSRRSASASCSPRNTTPR